MPLRNMGTLVENIVLLEAFRHLLMLPGEGTLDFANCFAMPPLSQWANHELDSCIQPLHHNALVRLARPCEGTYSELLWHCLRLSQTQGPNGALLCCLLASQKCQKLQIWLNDVSDGHYGNAIPALTDINAITERILDTGGKPSNHITVCDRPYPMCLSFFQQTIIDWPSQSRARIGFLDPMNYTQTNPRPGQTSSTDHRQWLRLLADKFDGPVYSVHFTANRNLLKLGQEVAAMIEDAQFCGFQKSVIAAHGHYRTIVSVFLPGASQRNDGLFATQIRELILVAWNNWCQVINRPPCAFQVEIN